MKKFEIGKEYFDRSACNHDCIFTIKIIKRTEKTVTFERNGKTRRADVNTVVVMVGQRVERVCGACYPPQGGTVIGFVSLPDTRFFHGGVFAMVLYDGAKAPERVRLSDIHRRGWRSPGGSPLGVFVA